MISLKKKIPFDRLKKKKFFQKVLFGWKFINISAFGFELQFDVLGVGQPLVRNQIQKFQVFDVYNDFFFLLLVIFACVCVCVCVCVERGAGAGTKLDHTSTIFLSTHFGVGYVLRGKITQQLSVRTSKIFQSGCSLQRLNISANKFRSTLCVCSPCALVGFF